MGDAAVSVKEPYSLSSDQHCHEWSQFATVGGDGVNSRLRIILDELLRQAEMTRARGWKTMVLGGDLFHVRGKITPSVLNPTIECFKQISSMGVTVEAIAGNHDLEYVYANQLGNAMQALAEIPNFKPITDVGMSGHRVFIPWVQDLDDLREKMKRITNKQGLDLIIHAPVNGIIKGLPDHGLEAFELAALGYDRVFSGHYHNHVEPVADVYSIGATTHQTWSDPDTLAGFCMVSDKVEHIESNAPKFVNVDTPGEATEARIKGNYVRLRLADADESVIKATRASCEQLGALGIVDHSSKKRPTVRGVTNVPAGTTLAVSVANYVKDHLETKLDKARVAREALAVLAETTNASHNP